MPEAIDRLHPRDRQRLQLLRTSMPGWLAHVDRLPPSELLDRILAESAYAAEIAGPSYRQSRENLKKIRLLVRRLQNRGYATLGRIVDHFAEVVAGGDESNAIVDAVDAVNLMTTHAAKGLEFPIVFVANMQRGSGGGLDPIRVVAPPAESGGEGEPSVAIGDHETPADRDLEAREAEEGKRLLYVALTRARDRLYLAATLNALQQLMPGKGGLGRTLPPAIAALFGVAAAASDPRVEWSGASGSHRFRVIRTSGAPPALAVAATEEQTQRRDDDFSVLAASGPRRVHVPAPGRGSLPAPEDADVLWWRDGVSYSLRDRGGQIIRGTIDRLVRRRSGEIDVIAYRSGLSSGRDEERLAQAVKAARRLFAGSSVHGRVVDDSFAQQLSS
jgi:hypothetical protein